MFGSPAEKKLGRKSEKFFAAEKVIEYKMSEVFFSSKGSSGHVEIEIDTHAKSLCQNFQGFTQFRLFP